jgi:uncharacterized protein with GYD domain
MAKYLVQVSYTPEGLKGLMKDKASGRKAAVSKAVASAGGKLELLYFSFGEHDVVAIVELPDNASAASLAVAVSAAGLVRLATTPLLSVEEMDQALGKAVNYHAPGT